MHFGNGIAGGWSVKLYQQLQKAECLVLDNPFFLLDKWKSLFLYLSFLKHSPYNCRAGFKFKLIRLFCFPKLHDNGPLSKLSHGPPFAVMGTNLIRNRAGLVKSPTYRTDTHSDPSRPEVPFVHSSLLCIFPSLIHLCVGAGGDYFCSRKACWRVKRKLIVISHWPIWMINCFLNVSFDLSHWITRLIKMPIAGYWRLRAPLHWFDLWDRRLSFSASQHYSLLQIGKSGPIHTNFSDVWTREALFCRKDRQTFSPVTCIGSVCPSWWQLLALDGLHVDCPSCFIKQLGLRALSWVCAHHCQQESGMTVPAAGSQGEVVAQEQCWAVGVLLLEMLTCMPVLVLVQCWCCMCCCCLLFAFFHLHPHNLLLGSTLSICRSNLYYLHFFLFLRSLSSGRLEVQPWLIPAASMRWSHTKDAKRGESHRFLG